MTRDEPVRATLPDTQDALLAHHTAGMIRRYVFPKDTVLFRKGESRQCAYLIDKGQVRIVGNDEGGDDKLLCTLGSGEIFGEMALIDNTPRTATAITAEESAIFIIPRDALHKRLNGLDPMVSLLISLLVERYRMTRIHLPESIKQDSLGHFLERFNKSDIGNIGSAEASRTKALHEMQLEQDLRTALERREFIPVLQPILNLTDRSLAGFEALVRWQHPQKGLLTPDHFIPDAERTGFVVNIDRMMIESACEVIAELDRHTDSKPFVSVNLSGIHFEQVNLVQMIESVMDKYAVDPARLHLEITESALIPDPEQAEKVLQDLKRHGFAIALDDFGTGYSSLGYLHKFSIDMLKIDRTFIAQLQNSPKSKDIVSAIVALAKTFKLDVVAEGIEQEEDIAILQQFGCDYGQGYYFSKPLPPADAYAFVDKMK